MSLRKLKREVKKDLGFKGKNIPYRIYSEKKTILESKNEYITSELAPECDDITLTAIYNLCDRMPKKSTILDLKKHLSKIKSNKIEYNAESKSGYYFEKLYPNNPFEECVLGIISSKKVSKNGQYLPIECLEEYLLYHPNFRCSSEWCFGVDKKTINSLVKKRLVYKPNRGEMV